MLKHYSIAIPCVYAFACIHGERQWTVHTSKVIKFSNYNYYIFVLLALAWQQNTFFNIFLAVRQTHLWFVIGNSRQYSTRNKWINIISLRKGRARVRMVGYWTRAMANNKWADKAVNEKKRKMKNEKKITNQRVIIWTWECNAVAICYEEGKK